MYWSAVGVQWWNEDPSNELSGSIPRGGMDRDRCERRWGGPTGPPIRTHSICDFRHHFGEALVEATGSRLFCHRRAVVPETNGGSPRSPREDNLELEDDGAASGIERRIPDDLQIGLELCSGRQLHGVGGFEDVFVFVDHRLRRRRGLAPGEAEAEVIVTRALDQQ